MSFFKRLFLFSVAAVLAHSPSSARAEDAHMLLETAATDSSPPEKPISENKTESYVEDDSLSGNFLSGRFARAKGDRDGAIRFLKDTLAKDPDNANVSGQLLVLSLIEGEMDSALERAHVLEHVQPHEPLVDLVLAVESVRKGNLDDAEMSIRKVFAQNDAVLWKPLFLGWADAGRKQLKKPLLLNAVVPEKQEAPAFLAYQLALINDYAGFKSTAEQQFDLALVDHSRAPFRAVETAADFYRRHGMKERLAQLKLDFTSAHPGVSALADDETATQVAAIMQEEVTAKNTKPLVADSADGVAEVLFTMASVLYAVDAQQDTQIYLRLALHLRPNFPLAQLLLAGALEDEKRYAEAEAVYAGIHTTGPLAERALLRRAYMIEKQGKRAEAIAMLDARAAEFPDDTEALIAKGDLLRSRSDYKSAAEAYGAALARVAEVKPSHWGIFFARGACYERVGEWEKAEVDLRQAIALNPEQPEVLNYLGYSLLTRSQSIPEAAEMIEKAYNLQPNAPHIIDSMGWALYKTGDLENAVQMLESAIELTPSDASVNDHLGDVYWHTGRKTEARFQWQRALTYSPDAALQRSLEAKLKDGLPAYAYGKPAKTIEEQVAEPLPAADAPVMDAPAPETIN